jgi:hypothetical protein
MRAPCRRGESGPLSIEGAGWVRFSPHGGHGAEVQLASAAVSGIRDTQWEGVVGGNERKEVRRSVR